MTDDTLDPFDQVRRALLAATTRDVRRRERRRHVLVVTSVVCASLVALTGIAAAADERVASAIGSATDSITQVFSGPESKPPSEESTRLLRHMEDMRRGIESSHPAQPQSQVSNGKVLLDGEFDGERVEIVASDRPEGSPTHWGPSKDWEICYSTSIGGEAGSVICTNAFNPGIPANYGGGWEGRPGGDGRASLYGVLASSVVQVRVVTPAGTEDALMGDHSFYWHSDEVRPTAVEFVLDDGTVKRDLRPQ